MVAIKNILIFVAAVSALSLDKRTAAQIKTDIANVDKNIKALTSAANSYNGGGISNALKVQSVEQTLEDSITTAGKDANATGTLSSADSTSISNSIQSPLIPDLEAAIKAVEAKKTQFTKDGVLSVVQDDLKSLKSKTDSLASRLITIASSDVKAKATQLKTTIDNDLNAAIKFFAS